MKVSNLKLIFIPRPSQNPVTGGEIYNLKLVEFLREKFRDLECIEIKMSRREARKSYQIILFGVTSLIRNFLYLFIFLSPKLNAKGRKVIVLEDIYYSTDLFLFNLLIKRFRRNISIVPIVHHLYYSLQAKWASLLMKEVEIIFLSESNLIITTSNATKESIKEIVKTEQKFLIAHPGLDKDKGIEHRIKSHNHQGGNLIILSVGSITRRKDIKTLIKSVKILVEQFQKTDFSVIIVGDLEKERNYVKEIMQLVKALSVSNYISFKGWVNNEELSNFFSLSDIFITTSLYEGFGMTIAEAMYNHLPVVATNTSAIPYLVQDGFNGFLVPPRDYNKFAEKINLLLESEDLRNKMGAEGFCKSKKFDWNKTFNKIYDKLLVLDSNS